MHRHDHDGQGMSFGDYNHAPENAYLFDHGYAQPIPDALRPLLPDNELFSAREYAHLRFVRWLVHTNRLEP
jgi:hypothetical protein